MTTSPVPETTPPPNQPVLDALHATNVDDLTPREALDVLYGLKSMLEDGE